MISGAEPRDILNFLEDLLGNIHARRLLLDWLFDNIDPVSHYYVPAISHPTQSHFGMKSAPR